MAYFGAVLGAITRLLEPQRRRARQRPRCGLLLESLETRLCLSSPSTLVWYNYGSSGPATALTDVSGNGYDATSVGTIFVPDRPPGADRIPGVPLAAGSLQVDGNTGSGAATAAKDLVTNTAIDNSGGLTMETWFNRAGTNNNSTSIQKLFQIELENFFIPRDSNQMGWSDGISPPPLFATVGVQEWHHVAAVFAPAGPLVNDTINGELRLYLDGQLADSQAETLTAARDLSSNPLYVGRSNTQFETFNGRLFETRITLGALTPDQFLLPAANAAPTANPGGPYTTTYGSGLTLDGSASTDPDSDPLTYTWTVNGQTLTPTNTTTQTLSWADLQALGITAAGSYTISLTVDDGHGGVNTSADAALTVYKADQTIDFGALTDKTYGDGPVTLAGTGGGSGNPVTFSVTGPASLGADGVTLHITGAGTVIVTASQAGNDNYNPAPSVEQSFNVAKYSPTGSIAAVPTAAYSGAAHGTTGAVLGVAGTVLNSTVVYTDASGTVVTAPVAAGSYVATVSFAGDDNYAAQGFSTPIVITQATPIVTVAGGTFLYDGQPHPAAGSVAGVNGENLGSPTFLYAYTDNSGNLVTSSSAPVEPGYYTVTASFAGNRNYEPAWARAEITIAFEAHSLTDLSKALHAGRTIPIKLQLLDANGRNLSSSSIALTAMRLERVNTDGTVTQVALQDAGNANPNNLFRYDAALNGYIFNLSTKGFSAGTYHFYWMAAGDPTEHELSFQLV